MIPYSRQSIGADDVEAVIDVLRSDWLTSGPNIERFESALTEYTGARHAVSFANGTAALHGCMDAARIGPGRRVLTSPLSFSASANCARYVGAQVGFVDIDPETLNLDPALITGCDALIAVHYSGLPMDVSMISNRPRFVIEDAAQALGARTADGPVGNCAHSDMTVFSFHPVKSITTGEGGAVTTNDDTLAERLRCFRSHGIEQRADLRPWEYDITRLGYNYRLTDFQAALGSSQIRKLDGFVDRRNELAETYDAAFANTHVRRPPSPPPGTRHARHLYPVRMSNRDEWYVRLRAQGIGVQVHHLPIYRLSVHHDVQGSWPATDAAYDQLLSLPLHQELTADDQNRIIDLVLTS